MPPLSARCSNLSATARPVFATVTKRDATETMEKARDPFVHADGPSNRHIPWVDVHKKLRVKQRLTRNGS